MKIGTKINVGNSSYGMKNVIMEFVEKFKHRCDKAKFEKTHNPENCLDCYDIDYWDCGGCNDDDSTVIHHSVGHRYNIKCDC